MGKACGPDAGQGCVLVLGRDSAVGEIIAAADHAETRDINEPHSFGFTGFEAHGGPCGNVQMFAVGLTTVEAQLRIGLDEVIMAANLHRAIAKVRNRESDRAAASVEL